ncbi:MAG: hypothetical protein U0361_03125 [Nitrospiraceae bacterium]
MAVSGGEEVITSNVVKLCSMPENHIRTLNPADIMLQSVAALYGERTSV